MIFVLSLSFSLNQCTTFKRKRDVKSFLYDASQTHVLSCTRCRSQRERERKSTNTRGGKKISVRDFSRPIFLSFSLHMELLCFFFLGEKKKARVWCVCVVVFAALFFCLRTNKSKKRKKKKKKKKTACRLFPHTRESERSQVRETIIISSSAAAACARWWRWWWWKWREEEP